MRKLEVSLVACIIAIAILATLTVWYYELNVWQENNRQLLRDENESLRRQTNTLQRENENLQRVNDDLEDDIDNLQNQVDTLQSEVGDLEDQIDVAYDEGYIQGVTDGAGRGYNIRDPTYQEALQFIALDQTNKNEYSETYTCFHFTADFEKNAFEARYRCGFVYIEFPDGAHAIVCFNTTDHGLIFIEPQDDKIVTVNIGYPYWDRAIYEPPDYNDTVVSLMIIW